MGSLTQLMVEEAIPTSTNPRSRGLPKKIWRIGLKNREVRDFKTLESLKWMIPKKN